MVRTAPTTSLGFVALCGCLIGLACLVAAGPLFASDGGPTPQTLRVDFFHSGDATIESFELDAFVLEGEWPGSKNHLTDGPDFGVYKAEVTDDATGRLLFSQGFCTLFGEWRTTDEAKEKKASYHETLRFPLPEAPATLKVFSRTRQNAWSLSWTLPLNLKDLARLRDRPQVPKDTTIVTLAGDNLNPTTALDLVFIADGYTAAHKQKAVADLQRMADVLLATPPFDRYKDRIAIRGVIPASSQTGPDEPRKQRLVAPPAGLTFNTFGSERYLTTSANRQLRDLAGLVPYDFLLVLSNTARYGGGGIYNFFAIGISDNDFDEYVWMHEFGHAFAGLGDEYYSSGVALTDIYPPGVEPWEPNITALLDGPSGLKWKHLAAADTPIPTPDEPRFDTGVGAFEGAGYVAKGLYRPARDCKMFSKKNRDFCPVCMKTIEFTIRLFVE